MRAGSVFLRAVEALRSLRRTAPASYLLYSSERRCAWVGACERRLTLQPGEPLAEFVSAANAAGGSGLFLVSPDLGSGSVSWPPALRLEPRVELAIDEHGVRWLRGEPDRGVEAALTEASGGAPSPTPRGAARREAWQGESDESYCARLGEAIALTRGRAGKIIVTRRYERELTAGAGALSLLRLLGSAEPGAAAVHYAELGPGLVSMGTSPENVVELYDGRLSVDAVAGTKPCSDERDADAAYEAGLLASAKERREHAMAVERARAFADQVCAPGSVRLAFERQVRRLRAVRHLHSRVEGRLLAELDFAALLLRCHPPLVSYPPELAAQVAPPWQGHYYGGMVGRFAGAGGSSFLNLRCIEIDHGRIGSYAGVGVVDGSSIESELEEVRNKLGTVHDVVERWLAEAAG